MHVSVTNDNISLRTLLDSGSMHNFIDIVAAEHAGVGFTSGARLCVAVANGDRITSLGCCSALNINIAGEHFVISYYGLLLDSFDMVLGVQWLEYLGPVLWYFVHRTLVFIHNSHHVLWSVVASLLTLAVTSPDVMNNLFLQYTNLFSAPTSLPLAR
jgi:hypothetical protein